MAEFDSAVQVVLQNEGGTGTLEGDPGGYTCYGWSKRTCDQLNIPQPTTPEQAAALYQEHFWPAHYDQITSQTLATKLFDMGVNQGQGTAVKQLQQALNKVGSTVTADGLFGPATLTAMNLVPQNILLPALRLIQYQNYCAWIKRDPVREKLRRGMANRAAWPDPDGSIAKALIDETYQGAPE